MNPIRLHLVPAARNANEWTCFYIVEGGKRVFLHSRYTPSKDMLPIRADPPFETLLCHGLGLGYHLQPHKIPPCCRRIIVLNEDILFFRKYRSFIEQVLELHFTEERIDAGAEKAVIYTGATKTGVAFIVMPEMIPLSDPMRARFFPGRLGHNLICQLPALHRVCPETPKHLSNWLRHAFVSKTKRHFARRWHVNILRNLCYLAGRHGFFYFHKTAASPRHIAVLGASPYLNQTLRNPAWHSFIQRKCLIIAADTAASVAAHYGVCPHIILSTDASPWTLRQHLLNRNDSSAHSKDSGRYLCNLCSPPELIRDFDYPPFLAFRSHPVEQLLAEFLPIDQKPMAFHGTNVGTMAIDMASYWKDSRIWVAGIDMRYPNGITYADPTMYSRHFLGQSNRLSPLPTQYHRQLQRLAAKAQTGYHYISESLYTSSRELQAVIQRRGLPNQITFIAIGDDTEQIPDIPVLPTATTPPSRTGPDRETPVDVPKYFIWKRISGPQLRVFLRHWTDLIYRYKACESPFFSFWPDPALSRYIRLKDTARFPEQTQRQRPN